jgi:hypothetical protein
MLGGMDGCILPLIIVIEKGTSFLSKITGQSYVATRRTSEVRISPYLAQHQTGKCLAYQKTMLRPRI